MRLFFSKPAEVLVRLGGPRKADRLSSITSLAFEDLTETFLQETLANLVEPLSPAELGTLPRSRCIYSDEVDSEIPQETNEFNGRTSSLTYTKPLVFTSTSFERGSDATRSPPPSSLATSPEPCRSTTDSVVDVNRSPILSIHHSPTKKRRSNSVGHLAIVGLAGRPRDSTVSTSAVRSPFVLPTRLTQTDDIANSSRALPIFPTTTTLIWRTLRILPKTKTRTFSAPLLLADPSLLPTSLLIPPRRKSTSLPSPSMGTDTTTATPPRRRTAPPSLRPISAPKTSTRCKFSLSVSAKSLESPSRNAWKRSPDFQTRISAPSTPTAPFLPNSSPFLRRRTLPPLRRMLPRSSLRDHDPPL